MSFVARTRTLAVVLVLLAVPEAHAARAAESDGVTIEASGPEDLALRLVAADSGRFAYLDDEGDLLVATPGQSPIQAGRVAVPSQVAYGRTQQFDLKGNTLRWAEAGPSGSVLHTLELPNAEPVVQRTKETLLTWTPDGWIGFGGGVLTQHDPSGAHPIQGPGLPDSYDSQPKVASDGSRTLVGYTETASRTETMTTFRHHVLLVQGRGATVTSLFDKQGSIMDPTVGEVMLTPKSEVWSLNGDTVFPRAAQAYRRDSASGAVTHWSFAGVLLNATDKWVFSSYTYYDKWSTWKYVTTVSMSEGDAGQKITLPKAAETSERIDDVSGPVVSDGKAYLGAGGNAGERAGVYEIEDDGGTTRVLRPPHRRGEFVDLALGEKRLVYAQAVDGADAAAETDLFVRDLQRSGSDGQTLEAAAQRRLPFRLRRPGTSSALSLSGDTLLARSPSEGQDYFGVSSLTNEPMYLRQRGRAPAEDARIEQSGPYTLTDGRLYRLDLSRVLLNVGTDDAALFGPRVIWRTAAGEVKTQEVFGENMPRTLVKSGAAGPVALYGTRYAWLNRSGRIEVRELSGGAARVVGAGADASDLRLQEDTLSWTTADGTIYLLNLADPQAAPVTSALFAPYAVNDDLIAGLDASGAIRVQQLPFASGRSHPRLIAFTGRRTAPAQSDWWAPFALTSSTQDLTLRIRSQGKTIRTLRSTDTGDQVGFLWNGRTGSGAWAKAGRYEWVLTGAGINGGALTGADGRNPASGTLTLTGKLGE